ncbi:hypothetical protein GLE_3102 [Lysobacter enzymogenes]|uniref:Uncharacterized protein n=1 Tax=Lysobacter enzymogenes TaxID=69 RepID=A0A0S2DJ62_LYSEN|nr:hypothetical protein GLE_3102 [Lysobacter enzymogenes]
MWEGLQARRFCSESPRPERKASGLKALPQKSRIAAATQRSPQATESASRAGAALLSSIRGATDAPQAARSGSPAVSGRA